MKIDIVKATPPNKLNPTDVSQHVPFSGAHVGLGATATLREIASRTSKEDVHKFPSTCKNFLIESILQITQSEHRCSSPRNFSMPFTLQGCCSQNTFIKSICQKLPYLKDTIDLANLTWSVDNMHLSRMPSLNFTGMNTGYKHTEHNNANRRRQISSVDGIC